MHLSQGMVSFSLMSNTPPPLPSPPVHSPSRGNTPWVWGNKSSAVSPGLQASMLLLWDLAGLGQTGSPGPGPADTHNRCSFFSPPPQSCGIKKSFGVRTMGLSISLSFPASHPLHTVNFAYFHITSIKLHSLEPRHRVQHIVATVVNIAVYSWNDKNKFFNRVTSGITYCLLRAQISLRLLLWSYAHRRSLLRVRPR